MLNEKIYIFDDIIDIDLQEEIKNVLVSDYEYRNHPFPWYYVEDITLSFDDPNSQRRPGFTHEYVLYEGKEKVTGKQLTRFHNMFLPILKNACMKMEIKDINVLQGRSFLQLPLNLKDRSIDAPHVDADIDHLVVLYYVIDSDGATVIYKNKFEGYDNVPKIKELKELKRVAPKAG